MIMIKFDQLQLPCTVSWFYLIYTCFHIRACVCLCLPQSFEILSHTIIVHAWQATFQPLIPCPQQVADSESSTSAAVRFMFRLSTTTIIGRPFCRICAALWARPLGWVRAASSRHHLRSARPAPACAAATPASQPAHTPDNILIICI